MDSQELSYNPLLARFFLTPDQKKDKEKGKLIVKAFYVQQTNNSTSLNFFKMRNARQRELLLWSKGSQPMQEFLDFMSVSDANKSFVNIDMTQSRIAAQFVGTLQESMAKNSTYVCVNAIDHVSVNEKEQRMFDALFRMHEIETIKKVQEEFQIELEHPTAYVPDDEISAKVYFELEDRLPKEIRFEKIIEQVQNEIQFDKVINRKGLYDMIVLNVEATRIEKISNGKYLPRKCVPTNLVYNFFINDTGECEITQIGEFISLKVKDFRAKFGKSEKNPDGLTEKEIFDLAKLSTSQSVGVGAFTFTWNDNWNFNYNGSMNNYSRPYDDCSIVILDCEINCGEDMYYVDKKDAFGKSNLIAKQNIPYQQVKKDGTIIQQQKPDDVEIIKKRKQTWMRGVYAPYGDKMLYWGKPDLIITPYTDVYKPLSSFTINIPNNDGEYVPSLFERILEPLREYQITKLKRKQLIAQVRPSGIRIDVESARNIDLGSGDSISWKEVLRIFNQTGTEVWSSKGLDPLTPAAPAITNTAVDDSIQKIIGLTSILESIAGEIRQLIGVPVYRDGSDVGDRTAARLAEGQNQSSYNVTDYILNGHNQLWEETFYKICLLHWNDIVKNEPETKADMLNTRFDVGIKFKSTEYQKQLLEADIQRYSQVIDGNGNPLLSPKDAMMLREIDNYKLATWYLATTVEKNKKEAEEKSARLQQQNGQIQQQSLAAKAQFDKEAQAEKLQAEKDLALFKSSQEKQVELLRGFMQVAAKDETGNMIKYFLPALQQLVPNIQMPLMQENKQIEQGIQQQEMQQEQGGEPMQDEPEMVDNPQEGMMEEQQVMQ